MDNYDFLNTVDASFFAPQNFMQNTSENGINNTNFNNNMNYNNGQNGILSIYGPYEGFIKGNLFKNLYSQYKNYKPRTISPTSDREEALLNLNQIQFAMHELNLYLDIYPNDANAMKEFRNLKNTYNNLLNDYENRFGPITVNSEYLNNTPFAWSVSAWPWNGGNM